MKGPNASIDRCKNCIYWERISEVRGVCHIISYPEKFNNNHATIELLAREAGHLKPKPAANPVIDPRYTAAFVPGQGFHCTLYKVGKEQ